MDYKVIITTSGTGSRLKDLTKKTNKALININGKPVISYILERYSKNIPLVITVGYLADQVIEFFKNNYQDRQIEFVKINPYEGPGSSLGYSLLQTKNLIRCPFIFHACDTIVLEDIPIPDKNWIAGFRLQKNLDASSYRTQTVRDGKIIRLNEKGVSNFDLIHIGLTGVVDYDFFWKTLEKLHSEKSAEDTSLSDVHVVEKMIENNKKFYSVELKKWFDTGNPEALLHTARELK